MITLTHIIDKYIAVTEHRYDYLSLCSYIDSLQQVQESVSKSNLGGWQSDTFILSEKYQEHRELYTQLGAYASEVASSLFQNEVCADLALSVGIFNRIGFRDSHARHFHTGCSLCSIIYLNEGDNFSNTSFSWDPIAVSEPLLNRNIHNMFGENLSVEVPSKKGKVLFFPPHFAHGVTPHLNTDKYRYSLACNWNFVKAQ